MEQLDKRNTIMDNYLNPYHKEEINNNDYIKTNANNTSCIDNIDLYVKIEDNLVKDIRFNGEACAISTSATSILIKELINKTINEVELFINEYKNMIEGKPYNEELLGLANCYDDIYKQENRKTCAILPYKALEKAIKEYKEN